VRACRSFGYMDVLQAIESCGDEKLLSKVKRAIQIIERTIDLYG
jgi:hypothetical protein